DERRRLSSAACRRIPRTRLLVLCHRKGAGGEGSGGGRSQALGEVRRRDFEVGQGQAQALGTGELPVHTVRPVLCVAGLLRATSVLRGGAALQGCPRGADPIFGVLGQRQARRGRSITSSRSNSPRLLPRTPSPLRRVGHAAPGRGAVSRIWSRALRTV